MGDVFDEIESGTAVDVFDEVAPETQDIFDEIEFEAEPAVPKLQPPEPAPIAPTFEAPVSITEQGPVYKEQQAELDKQAALWKPTTPIQPPSLQPVRETESPPLFKPQPVPGSGIPLTTAEKALGPSEQTQKDQARLEILRNAVDLASKQAQRDLTKAELAQLGETAARAVDFIGAIQRIPTEQGLLGAIGKPAIAAGEGVAGVAFGQGLNRIAEDVAAGDLNFPRFRSAVGRTQAGVGFSPLEKGAVDLANILPDIAVTGVGQAYGVPTPVTFGTLSAARAAAEGAAPEQVFMAGATGAAAPGAGQLGTKSAAIVLKGAVNRGLLSANRETALKALESLGGQAGFQAFFAGMSVPEIAAMPPDKRWDFIVEQAVKNSVFSVLDIPKFKRGIPSETRKELISDYLDVLAKQGPMGSVLRPPAERGVPTSLGIERPEGVSPVQPKPAAPAAAAVSIESMKERGSVVGATHYGRSSGKDMFRFTDPTAEPGKPNQITFTVPEGATRERVAEARKLALARARVGEGIPEENVQISVNSLGPEFPGKGFVQVDEVNHPRAGNVFSANPEIMKKAGLDMPSSNELLTLPNGKYTLPEARRLLAEKKAPQPTAPAVAAPKTTLVFHGEGGEGGVAGKGGAWYTTDFNKALSYGGEISFLRLTPEEAARFRQPIKTDYVVDAETLKRSQKIDRQFKQPVQELEVEETAATTPVTAEKGVIPSEEKRQKEGVQEVVSVPTEKGAEPTPPTPLESAIREGESRASEVLEEYVAGTWPSEDQMTSVNSVIDEVAKKHGVDPEEVRRNVLWRPVVLPEEGVQPTGLEAFKQRTQELFGRPTKTETPLEKSKRLKAEESEKALTPMHRRYREVKNANPDAVVLMRIGDFYEAFWDDAKILNEVTKAALTKRNNVPMAGVPYHAVRDYVARLEASGKKVFIDEGSRTPTAPAPAPTVEKGAVKGAGGVSKPYELDFESASGDRIKVRVSSENYSDLSPEAKDIVDRAFKTTLEYNEKEFSQWEKIKQGKSKVTVIERIEGSGDSRQSVTLDPPDVEFGRWATRNDLYDARLNKSGQALREKLISERESAEKAKAEKEAAERSESERMMREFREYSDLISQKPLPKGKKTTITVENKEGQKSEISGTAYGAWLIHKRSGGTGRYAQPTVYKVTHIPSGLGVSAEGLSSLEQARNYVRALIDANVRTDWKKSSDLSKSELKAILEVAKAWVSGGEVPKYLKAKQPAPPAAGEKGMGGAVPGEFAQPERAKAFRAFDGWTGRAKEALQRLKEYFTPPEVGALPEVEIQSGAILPRLPDYAKEKVISSAPHGMAKVPGLGALMDTRAVAHSPADAAFLARANSVSKGKTFAALWAQTQWRNKDLFHVESETGSFRLANGERGYLSDVIEAELRDPGSQPLTYAQWQWIHQEWKPVLDEINRMMHNEGVRRISTEDMDFELGKDYFPRPAIGKRNRPTTGAGGRPAGRPGAKQFFQKSRKYASEEEGARPGTPEAPKEEIVYDPDPVSRVTKFISGAYRSIADHRLANDPALGAGTVPDYWGIGRQTMAGPAFAGKVYPVEVAQKIERQFAQDIRGWVRATGNITAAAKALMATADMSAPFIQGAAMFGRNPVRWSRATINSYRALTDPTYVARLMEHPRYKELSEGYSQSGGSLLQLQDFLSGLQEGQLATRIPGYGRLLTATGRAYGAFLDLAKLELFDAWRKVTPEADMPRLVETIENSLFMGRMEQAGMNPHRAIGERLLLFAPSYYRGAGGLLSTALQKGVSGKVARQMLGGYAAAATLVSMSAYLAMGMDWDEIKERLQPGRGKFLKVPVSLGDGERIEVGIGNILTQLVRLAGQAANYHTSDKPIDTGVEANPYLRFLRGRSAFLPGVSIELATGRDYFGNRITAKESIARHFAPFVFRSMFPRDEASLRQRAGDAAFTFFGLNAYPESEYEKARNQMDETARKVGGKPFSQLNIAQRAKVVNQFKRSPDYKKREPSPNDMERIIHLNAERQANLQKSLGDSADKLARAGLRVPGYKGTFRYKGVDVPMTESERERYQDILASMYQARIAKLNEAALLRRPLVDREKWWSGEAEKIGIAARKKLMQEISKNTIK